MRSASSRAKPLRLRDFIRVKQYYFSVVGYKNQDKIKCFLRYVPNKHGDREKNGIKFKKVGHDEAVDVEYTKKYYDGKIFRVPMEDVDEVFKPEERLKEVLNDEDVGKVVNFFSGIPRRKMGVTGSRLIGLRSEESDIDFIVYGRWWFIAREKIKRGLRRGELENLDQSMWDYIYKKRKIPLPFEIFLIHELRKYHRAYIGNTYFDLLYVRDYNEISKGIPEDPGERLNKVVLQAKLKDDGLIFDYPAYYPIKSKVAKGILCFTHSFVGQVFKNETLEVSGQLERIDGNTYIIVGTKREVQDEYIVSLTLLEKCRLMNEFKSWRRLAELHPSQQKDHL